MDWLKKLKNKISFLKPAPREIATTKMAGNFLNMFDWLPDPDPILSKMCIDYQVYRELESEGHIFSCIISRTAGVLNKEHLLKPAGDSKKEQYAYDFIKEVQDNCWDTHQIISEILDAPLYGFVPLELLWNQENGHWYIENIIAKPQEWFAFGKKKELLFISKESLNGEQVPPNNFITAQFRPSYLNPYGKKILSRCFWPALFRKNGVKFWLTFIEKYGNPYVLLKYAKGTKKADIDKILETAEKMVRDAVIACPDDGSAELLTAGDKRGSSDLYKGFKEDCDKEISKVILGHSAAADSTPGKLGNESGMLAVRKDIIDEDQRLVANTMQKAINLMILFEFGDISLAPKFCFFEEEDIKKDLAERDNLLSNRIKFLKKYYMNNYNLKEDEFELIGDDSSAPSDDIPNYQAFVNGPEKHKKQTKKLKGLSQKFAAKVKYNPYEDISKLLKESKDFDDFEKKLKGFLDTTENIEKVKDKLATANLTAEAIGRNSGE